MNRKTGITFAAAAMLAAALPLTTFAGNATVESVTTESKIDVEARYAGSETTETVYKVDVEWGAMQFTYNASGSRVWNPNTHEYTVSGGEATWTGSDNTLTVTNHSNAAVTVDFDFSPAAAYQDLRGSFSKQSMELATAVGTDITAAPTDVTEFTLSGVLADTVSSFTTIGQITVTVK